MQRKTKIPNQAKRGQLNPRAETNTNNLRSQLTFP